MVGVGLLIVGVSWGNLSKSLKGMDRFQGPTLTKMEPDKVKLVMKLVQKRNSTIPWNSPWESC